MLPLLCFILAQVDPNAVYQDLGRPDKERVYLVYEREIKSRQNVDEAVEATAAATSKPPGAVRLIVREMKRAIKREEAEEEREKEEDRKKPGNVAKPKRARSSSSGSTRPARPRKTNTRPVEQTQQGDGIKNEGSLEKVKLESKEYLLAEFEHRCRLILPEHLSRVKEKIPFAIDGRVRSRTKDYTIVDTTKSDGTAAESLVVVHSRSADAVSSLDEADPVRIFGWIPKKEDIKDKEVKADGTLFFAMVVDKEGKDFSGAQVTGELSQGTSASGKKEWDVAVKAMNNGDRPLTDLEVEVNLIVDAKKPADAIDQTFVYFARIEPGQSATVNTSFPDWTEDAEKEKSNTTPPRRRTDEDDDDEKEEIEVKVATRIIGGKVSKE